MQTTEADVALDEIESVLELERVALRTLDVPMIEKTTSDKARLDARIGELAQAGRFEPRHKDRVKAIREIAAQNQLLLANARSCVRAGLAHATGSEPVGYGKTPSQPPTSANVPVRVNVRG